MDQVPRNQDERTVWGVFVFLTLFLFAVQASLFAVLIAEGDRAANDKTTTGEPSKDKDKNKKSETPAPKPSSKVAKVQSVPAAAAVKDAKPTPAPAKSKSPEPSAKQTGLSHKSTIKGADMNGKSPEGAEPT